jgi:hypothetical protein
MGLSLSGRAKGAPILEAWDAWDGYHLYSNNPSAGGTDFTSSVFSAFAVTNPPLLASVSGSVGAVAFDLTIGRSVQTWASGAAATGQGSSWPFGMPIRTRFALPGSPPIGWVPKPRRFRADFVARITVVGTADVTLGVGIDGATIGSGNNGCVVWQSRPAVNAGRWMPRHRDVTAGAFVDGPDSGVTAAAFHRFSFIYEEGLTPVIRWLLDDVERFQLAGDAAMPQPPAGQFGPFLLGKGVSAPAGTTVQYLATHFLVEEL